MRFSWLAALSALLLACDAGPASVAGDPGTPLRGLGEEEASRFFSGQALFNKIFTPEEGLGPAFNENQCSACHTSPAVGGSAASETITKATRHVGPGTCDLLEDQGGLNVRKQATPSLRATGVTREAIPADATEVARFITPFLFGLGLVEAIPEETILARADPEDADGDGISGRAARAPDGRLTRFGGKAEIATIEQFVRSALFLEMGLTTEDADRDVVGGAPAPGGTDAAPEPEVDRRTVELLTAFTRFLAPPARAPARSGAHADTLATGARLFAEVGCGDCHTPSMRTGPNDVPALHRKTVYLYSDLLLHDMGPALASICGADAEPREYRTTMLMGLQYREFFLHDGRTMDLREAILAHGGEARSARDAFARLPWLHQEYIVMFLRTL